MSATATKPRAKKASSEEVVIRNAGAIEGEFRFPLDSFGVYEFQGSNGVGKSTALRMLRLLTGHKVDVTVHHGALDGSIEALGAVAPLGRKQVRGELEIGNIESDKWSIDDVTDPAGERPEVRDANRIKALAALSGTKADPAPYLEIMPNELDRLIDRKKLETDDPLILQSRVKDAFESAARQSEAECSNEKTRAAQCRAAFEGIDLDAPHDAKELAGHSERAAAALSALESQSLAAVNAKRKSTEARENLRIARENYKGKTLEQAREDSSTAVHSRQAAADEVAKLDRQLATAKELHRAACAHETAAAQAVAAAEQHEKVAAHFEALIQSSADVPEPTSAEIEAARETLNAARLAAEQGVRVRDGIAKAAEHARHAEAATEAEKVAISFRGAAAMTFDVLTQSVKLTGIRIENVDGSPRLIVDHPKTGKPCFFDGDRGGLSDGERSIFAMRTLRHLIPSPGLFAVPQRVWESLSPAARAQFHREAVEQKVYLFCALPTDGALRVERPYR